MGGKAIDAFNKIIGQEFERQFLSSFRNAEWKCLNKESTKPLLDWGTNFWKMPLPQKAAFLYGGFLVVKNIVEYWEK